MNILVMHRQQDNTMVPVANVVCGDKLVMDALSYAWEKTNNIEGSWSMGKILPATTMGKYSYQPERNLDFCPDVSVLAPLPVHNNKTFGLRSSQVNDIMVDLSTMILYKVASCGFEEIGRAYSNAN